MDTEVRRDPKQERYEIYVDDELVGIADYMIRGDKVIFPHTEITRSMRGKGLGEILVRHALDEVRQAGKTVVPLCWFVAQFIDENPEYNDLLAA